MNNFGFGFVFEPCFPSICELIRREPPWSLRAWADNSETIGDELFSPCVNHQLYCLNITMVADERFAL